MTNSNGKKPERTFRLGNISSSVFVNETTAQNGNGTSIFRSVTVTRSYRDGNTTKYDTSFTARDLPAVIRVLQLAQQHVEQMDVLRSQPPEASAAAPAREPVHAGDESPF